MSVLPNSIVETIQFCETHLPVWQAAPSSIGLTPLQIEPFASAVTDARDAFEAAQAARSASKAATTTLNANAATLRASAGDLIRTIKAFAEMQADPASVYASAQIPTPLPPSPLPAPGIPNAIRVTLEPSGAVTLSWDAVNAAASSGAFYNVSRKLPGQSGFSPIGGAPGTTSASRRMSFTDFSVPTSAAGSGAQYIIQGQRGTETGLPSEAVTVQFGVDGSGSFQVNGQSSAIKLAA